MPSFRPLAPTLLLLCAVAVADDAAISWSGAPTMLNGHGTIRMMAEKIVLHIDQGKDPHTDADCTYRVPQLRPCNLRPHRCPTAARRSF